MSLLVFLVLLFGLFGIFLSQYIIQYREAYVLWIKEIVYCDGEENLDCHEKRMLCSKLESYSREICGLADIISFLFVLICFTFIVIVFIIKINLPLIETGSSELNILWASGILSLVFFLGLPVMLYYSKINIISSNKTSAIDRKIFSVWYKLKCHDCKHEEFQDKSQPHRLYELLDEIPAKK